MSEKIGGPYLSAAFFCERVLRETDNVPSFIRVTERCTINGASDVIPLTIINTTLVITMISGMHRGPSKVAVSPISPSGIQLPSLTLPVNFEGDDDRGIAIVIPMGFPVQEQGVYWFEISVEGGGTVTRIPFRIVYQQMVQQATAAKPNQ